MSEEQKAEARAQGALENFLSSMEMEIRDRQRSMDYEVAFWTEMQKALRNVDTANYGWTGK